MNFRRKKILLAILLIGYGFANAQVVNIEKSRKATDTTGFAGGMELRGSYLDYENSILSLSVIPDVQYKTQKDLFLFLGNYNLTKSELLKFQDAAFAHFRYNRKLNNRVRWEAFTQLQNDLIAKLRYRFLIGTGPRLKLLEFEKFRLYSGTLPMFEWERLKDAASTAHTDFRLSQYFSFTLDINDQARLISTSYYQPLLKKWSDYRIYSENQLSVKIFEKLRLNVTGTYAWDEVPPTDAPRRLLRLATGFEYRLN